MKDVKSLIDYSKSKISQTINQELTLLYWNIGKTIQTEILKFEKPEYGEHVIHNLGAALQYEYGKGFGPRVLRRTLQFFNCFPDVEIVSTVSTQLTWSHFVELIPIQDPLKREFYTEMCRLDSWSVRTLREKIGKMLYERTAISDQADHVIKESLSLIESVRRKPHCRMVLKSEILVF